MTDSERITIDELTTKVKLTTRTLELFTIPVPRCQQEFLSKDLTSIRVLDNPLEESMRNYVAWGKFKV